MPAPWPARGAARPAQGAARPARGGPGEYRRSVPSGDPASIRCGRVPVTGVTREWCVTGGNSKQTMGNQGQDADNYMFMQDMPGAVLARTGP